MKLSTITGTFSNENVELSREQDGEKFYLYTLTIEDGLEIRAQVSEYLEVPIGVPVEVTGCLSSCKRFSEERGRSAMFTFFEAKLITTPGDNYNPSKRIECSGTVTHIYNMTLTRGGTEKVTIVVRERQGKNHIGIVHYTAMGKLARQLVSTLRKGDSVDGYGMLRKKTESFEVLLSELTIIHNQEVNNYE